MKRNGTDQMNASSQCEECSMLNQILTEIKSSDQSQTIPALKHNFWG